MSPIATGGLWFQEMLEVAVDQEVSRAEEMENQIDVFGKSILGLTLGCARCHDHKFDPITTADYYSLGGVFMSTSDAQYCVDSPQRQRELDKHHRRIERTHREIECLLDKARRSESAAQKRRAEASCI